MRFKNILSAAVLASIFAATSAEAADRFAGCKTGTPEQNIEIAKNFYKAYNTNDGDLLGRTLAEDYVSEPVTPGEPTGSKAAVERLKYVMATFQPTHIENVEFFTSGNKVIVRSDITATHVGNFMGLPPTGKTLRFGAIDIHTICNGKIVLGQHEEGWMAVMFQLGILPLKN